MQPQRTAPFLPLRVETSVTSPIQIDWPLAKIGITFAPGKHDAGSTALWRRNVWDDCRVIAASGGRVLVTLLEDHEFEKLKIEELGEAAKAAGLLWLRFPIRDVSTPTADEADAFDALIDAIVAMSLAGLGVVVHCRGGKGRAGTVVACAAFKALGTTRRQDDPQASEDPPTPEAVIRMVRAARKGAIETTTQERYVYTYARRAFPSVADDEPGWQAPPDRPTPAWFDRDPLDAPSRRPPTRGRSYEDEIDADDLFPPIADLTDAFTPSFPRRGGRVRGGR